MEKTIEERIENEKKRLGALFVEMPLDKFFVTLALIDRAAFLTVQLQEMEKDFEAVDTYQNGSRQSGQKVSAVLNAYNKSTKTLQAVLKQLTELIPYDQKYKYRPPFGVNENEFSAFKDFKKDQELEYFLSDEFKQKLEADREKYLELMLQGN